MSQHHKKFTNNAPACALRRRRAAGLTFVELCLGMTITSMVMAAVASFTLATASAWRHSKGGMTADGATNLLNAKLNSIMREARSIGSVRTGSLTDTAVPAAAVLFWLEDNNGDLRAQLSEIAAFDYDSTDKAFRYYRRAAPQTERTFTIAEFNDGTALDSLRSRPGATVVLKNVTAAKIDAFGSATSADRPRIGVTLRCSVGGKDQTIIAVSSMRAPTAEPQ